MSESFVVSAPGKVIIFGEHSAVYGKPAIAAAVDLRAYLMVTPSTSPDLVQLEFPDINLSQSWKVSEIPFEKVKSHVEYKDGKPSFTEELVPEIVEAISGLLMGLDITTHYITCHSFLYLYTILCSEKVKGYTFSVRSTLPIGAGLGSSASISVCLASALAYLGGHIENATLALKDKVESKNNENAEFIDQWSFMGEKCFHGNPSGIDNAVATYGGAVMFQRMKNQPSVRSSMRNFPPIDLLLTNTKIPRSTADLVANVARIYNEFPKTGQSIIESMEHLVTHAYQFMIRPFFGIEERKQLRELVNINHGLLVACGVSHPALEKIKIIGDEHNIGATKLTGAGGGGCAITLLNDNIGKDKLHQVEQEFNKLGFETYATSLGGKGVGMLNISSENKQLFDHQLFLNYKTRQDIIDALGVENPIGWKFW